MQAEILSETQAWEQRLRKSGIRFAEVRNFGKIYAKVAILKHTNTLLTIEYPLLKIDTNENHHPLASSQVLRFRLHTERLRVDVDTRVMELL